MSKIEIFKASAGSGKTYNLAYQYIRLILQDPYNKYESCLAVTFTNDATREMKRRIIEELTKLSKGEPSSYLAKLEEELETDTRTIRYRSKVALQNILHDYSRFSVKTIDSFIQKILRAFILDLGILENYNIELNTEKVINEVSLDVFRRIHKDKDLRRWLSELSIYKIRQGKSWNFKRDLTVLCKEILKESAWNNTSFKGNDQKALMKVVKTEKKRINSSIQDIAKLALSIISEKLGEEPLLGQKFKYIHNYVKRCAHGQTSIDYKMNISVQKALDGFENWHSKTANDQIKVALSLVYEEVLDCLENIRLILSTDYRLLVSLEEIQKNLYAFAIMHELNDALKHYRVKENILLISDTHQLLNQVIGGREEASVYEWAGNTYKHLLIDEFQDTSRLQWSNFKPLIINSLADNCYNMIVGDVKQSVYRWRGGDWHLLLKEVDETLGHFNVQHTSLNNNFRSTREIVDFNNHLFSLLPQFYQSHVNLEYNQLEPSLKEYISQQGFDKIFIDAYSGVEQVLPETEGGEVGIDFIHLDSKRDRNEKNDKVQAKLYKCIESLISEGYKADQITVLVRTNSEARDIVNMILSYDGGVSALSKDALLISNSKIVQLIINILEYVNNRDPVYLMSIHQLLNSIFSDKYVLNPEPYLSKDYINIEKDLKLDSIFEIGDVSVYELVEYIIALYGLSEIQSEIIYLQYFQEAILEYTQQKNLGLSDVLIWWSEEGHRFSVSLMSEMEAIQVSTIHKAKGLAYDIVIIPYCDWYLDDKKGDNILWCSVEDEPFKSRFNLPMYYNSRLKESLFYKEAYKESIYAVMDAINVFYVACTRARKKLFVWCFAPDEKELSKGNFSKISDLIYQCTYSNINNFQIDGFEFRKKRLIELIQTNISHKLDEVFNHSTNQNLNRIEKYPVYNWRDLYKIKNKSSIHFVSQNTSESQLAYGTMMHELLAKIKYKSDVDRIIEEFSESQTSWIDDLGYLKKKLDEYINYPPVSEWFDTKWDVLNERSIIEENNIYILDRVLMNKEETIVIDFKFGDFKEKHIRQVEKYKRLLISMGYPKTKGYLYYPDEKVVKII